MAVFMMILIISAAAVFHYLAYAKLWHKKLYFNLSSNKNAVFEGDKITLNEVIENKKLLPLPWIEVNFVFPRSFAPLNTTNTASRIGYENQNRVDLFSLPAKRRVSLKIEYLCESRGFYRVPDFTITSNNLMMSDQRSRLFRNNLAITVYPKVIDVSDMAIPYKKISGEILARRFIMPDPFEFRGIREYQPYDNFKAINFKASARTGDLMSNVFDFTVSQEIVIILNLQQYTYVTNSVVNENAIRLAAFFARYYIGAGIPVGFMTNGRDIATDACAEISSGRSQTHLTNIYEALARITTRSTPSPILDYLSRDFGNGERVYILISSYHEADLMEWFDTVRRHGSNPLWVVPYGKNDEINITFNDLIVGWEVNDD